MAQLSQLSHIQLPESTFDYQAPKNAEIINAKAAEISQKHKTKKRKAATAALSSASEKSSQNSAYYLQLAVDNLLAALAKETEKSVQTKIQFVLAKTQHILLNNAGVEFDSQLDIQNQIKAIQSDIAEKFQEIQNSIADLQFVNLPAANQLTIAEPASPSTDNSASAAAAATKASSSKLYAQIAAQASEKSVSQNTQEWQTAKSRAAIKATNAAAKAAEKTTSFRERRLILSNSRDDALDSMKMRDQVNQELVKQLKLTAKKPVLAAIVRSHQHQNIVLTTTEDYNADFLIQHEKVWSKFFKYSQFKKDFVWHKIVAHGISTEIFNSAKRLDLLKQEIETFNEVHSIAVNWLSNSQNKQQKMHESVVIAFDTQAAAQKALKRLSIAGIFVKTAAYVEDKTTEQCMKCQKFEHSTNTCKNLPVCQLYVKSHPTRLHSCKTCIHTVLKCTNCAGNHAANSKECNVAINLAAAKKLSLNLSSATDSSSVLAPDSMPDNMQH